MRQWYLLQRHLSMRGQLKWWFASYLSSKYQRKCLGIIKKWLVEWTSLRSIYFILFINSVSNSEVTVFHTFLIIRLVFPVHGQAFLSKFTTVEDSSLWAIRSCEVSMGFHIRNGFPALDRSPSWKSMTCIKIG